ncbi:hypothetical protein F5883DRAFT_206177 [Diaporthe sp. PMI_573]|nr:hypothetical protein F5883DRAFT_206177 [Diaporthaceae sp. PMI_573]
MSRDDRHVLTEQRTYDGNTYAFSSIFHTVTSTLQLYAHHMTAPTPPGGQPDYHMTKVKSYDMTGDYETFVAGAGAFRNLRELAKEHRDALILSANAKSRRHGRSKSTGTRAPQEAAPSPDVLGYATQDVNEEHTLPGYLYPEDDQQDQSQASMPYDALADPQTSITTSFTSSFTSCETHPKHTGDSDSSPASTDRKKRDSTEHKASHHTAGPTHRSGSEKKDHRSGRKSRPAGSDWEWDDDMREYKWWKKTRWEYWDEESQSRKYFDGKKWKWVTSRG